MSKRGRCRGPVFATPFGTAPVMPGPPNGAHWVNAGAISDGVIRDIVYVLRFVSTPANESDLCFKRVHKLPRRVVTSHAFNDSQGQSEN